MTDNQETIKNVVPHLAVEDKIAENKKNDLQTKNRISLAGQVKLNDKSVIPGVLIVIATGDKKIKTITANDGCFCFINLPTGEYTLKVYKVKTDSRKIGNKDEDKSLFITTTNHNISVVEEPKKEPKPKKWQDIFININIISIIKGKITDEKDNPVKEAKVKIQGSSQSIFSDATGEYEMNLEDINLFLQGSLSLEVSAKNYNIFTKKMNFNLSEIIQIQDFKLTLKDKLKVKQDTS